MEKEKEEVHSYSYLESKVKRNANFTKGEIYMLIDIVWKYKDIIENKKTDATTWADKNKAWLNISKEFNAVCGNFERSVKSIRAKYELIKKNLRKKCSDLKTEHNKTGGGVSFTKDLEPYEERILAGTQLSMIGLSPRFDKDHGAVAGSSVRVKKSIGYDVVISDNEDIPDCEYTKQIWKGKQLLKEGKVNVVNDNNITVLEDVLEPIQSEEIQKETVTNKVQEKFIHKKKRLKRQSVQNQQNSSAVTTDIIGLKKEVLQLQKCLLEEEKENKKIINGLVIENLDGFNVKKMKYKLLQERSITKDGYIEWADDF